LKASALVKEFITLHLHSPKVRFCKQQSCRKQGIGRDEAEAIGAARRKRALQCG